MNQPFDASIPVLTEIMPDELPAAAAPAPAPVAEKPAALDDAVDWEALERRVSEQVLQQLSNRVDFVLEQRIKDSMAEVLDQALHALTAQIREGLHDDRQNRHPRRATGNHTPAGQFGPPEIIPSLPFGVFVVFSLANLTF